MSNNKGEETHGLRTSRKMLDGACLERFFFKRLWFGFIVLLVLARSVGDVFHVEIFRHGGVGGSTRSLGNESAGWDALRGERRLWIAIEQQ